ncbi:MAG: hypothetical protein AAF871_11120 [Pseudomonadota bacterium]
MERVEIEKRLRGKSEAFVIAFAMRAALRVFPLVTHLASRNEATHLARRNEPGQRLVLFTCRAILTSGVVAVGPTPEFIAAADSARNANIAYADANAARAANIAAYTAGAADYGSARIAALGANTAYVAYAEAVSHAANTAEIETETDLGISEAEILATPLWNGGKEPAELRDALGDERDLLQSGPEWDFWRRWHRGALVGQPIPWDVQREVALIPNENWEKGAAHIAELIQGIEKKFEPDDPLDNEAAKKQVQRILKSALKSEVEARGLGQLIAMAIDAYRREISNALPDALEPLEQLPPVLNQIALVLSREAPATEKEEQLFVLIQGMARTINVLNSRLETAHADKCTVEAKLEAKSARKLFSDAFYTNAGAGFGKLVSSPLLWGPVIGGAAIFIGAGGEASTDRLAWLCNEVIFPENPEALQSPSSSSSDGAKFAKPPQG